MRLIIVRHASTEYNERRLVQGQKMDLPLSILGEQQAWKLGLELLKEPVRTIYTSPLKRACRTALLIGSFFVDISQIIHVCEQLREIDVGDAEGYPIDALKDKFPSLWEDWEGGGDVQWPNGERVSDIRRRMSEFLEGMKKYHPNDTIAVITHATPGASLLALGLGMPLGAYRQLWLDVGHYSILETQGRTDGYPCGARGMSLKLHNA